MALPLEHRGPDDGGVWVDSLRGVALAHRRLSILDVSEAGHQPMQSAGGRYQIVFNGEIYNFRELRSALEQLGARFKGNSDTEVLLTGIERWGIEHTLRRCIGMFALAVWDAESSRLTLARDRLGEKPLYYGRVGAMWAFASELRALRVLPGWTGMVDRAALVGLLRYGYVPAPRSIHTEISKVLPGTMIVLRPGHAPEAPRAFWSAAQCAYEGLAAQVSMDDKTTVDEVESRVGEAVSRCMVSDVPLGALLSGGTDSSLVVAMMQARGGRSIKTFSIGFESPDYDESGFAARVAGHLGTDHTSVVVTAQDALAVIPLLPRIYDEPFADVSQIPTYLVSKLARRAVTVALSGDGGDEVFGGYNRYTWGERLWRHMAPMPAGLRSLAGGLLTALPAPWWDSAFSVAAPLLPNGMRQYMPGDRVHKLANLLRAENEANLYLRMTSHWLAPEKIVVDAPADCPMTELTQLLGPRASLAERMMLTDLVSYLPDDVLTKVDRASMAVSLEARVPLLDHTLVEFAWRLPLRVKLRNGEGKWVLKQVLRRYLPEELVARPKMGFAVPLDAWLRGPLRDWAEDLLEPKRMADEGFFHPQPVRHCWNEHVGGRRQWQFLLWNVLMFQAWHRDVAAPRGAA